MTVSKETKLKEKSTRVKRRRLDRAGPLFIDEKHLEAGFHYRIVNDSPAELNKRMRMGYEIVQDKNIEVGDQIVGNSSRLGSAVAVNVSGTSEQKGVLMRIPVEDHAELVEELNEETDKQEEAMFADTLSDLSVKERNTIYGGIKKE